MRIPGVRVQVLDEGGGKTTLLPKLEERGVAIIPEPLDRQ